MFILTHGFSIKHHHIKIKSTLSIACLFIICLNVFLKLEFYIGLILSTVTIPFLLEICLAILESPLTIQQHMEWILKYKPYREDPRVMQRRRQQRQRQQSHQHVVEIKGKEQKDNKKEKELKEKEPKKKKENELKEKETKKQEEEKVVSSWDVPFDPQQFYNENRKTCSIIGNVLFPFQWTTIAVVVGCLTLVPTLSFYIQFLLWIFFMMMLHLYNALSGCCCFQSCLPLKMVYYKRSWSYLFCFFQVVCPYWMFHSLSRLDLDQYQSWLPFSLTLFSIFYASSISILLHFAFVSDALERMQYVSELVQKILNYFLFGILKWSMAYVMYMIIFHIVDFLNLSGLTFKFIQSIRLCCCSNPSRATFCSPRPFSHRELLLMELFKWKSRWMNFIHQLLSELIGVFTMIVWMSFSSSSSFYPLSFSNLMNTIDNTQQQEQQQQDQETLQSNNSNNQWAERIFLIVGLKFFIWVFSKPIQKRMFPIPIITTGTCPFKFTQQTLTYGLLEDPENVQDISRMGTVAAVLQYEHRDLFQHQDDEIWKWDLWMNYRLLLTHTFFYIVQSLLVLLFIIV
jgi:hypothetical protein